MEIVDCCMIPMQMALTRAFQTAVFVETLLISKVTAQKVCCLFAVFWREFGRACGCSCAYVCGLIYIAFLSIL